MDFDHKFKTKGEDFSANVNYSTDKNNNLDNLLSNNYDYTIPLNSISNQMNTTRAPAVTGTYRQTTPGR